MYVHTAVVPRVRCVHTSTWFRQTRESRHRLPSETKCSKIRRNDFTCCCALITGDLCKLDLYETLACLSCTNINLSPAAGSTACRHTITKKAPCAQGLQAFPDYCMYLFSEAPGGVWSILSAAAEDICVANHLRQGKETNKKTENTLQAALT